MARTIELNEFIQPDSVGEQIANYWTTWDNMRVSWLAEKKEIQEYVFATSTKNTTNQQNNWKNKVHIPKLCQIRDNLHANYMATLFPNDKAIMWEGSTKDAQTRAKSQAITSYMKNKIRQSKFRTEVSKLVLDFIDYGNCFVQTIFEADYTIDPMTGQQTPVYVGPRAVRIAPEDIVFDPTAISFEKTPKIVRSLKTLGSLRREMNENPDIGYMEDVFNEKVMEIRGRFAAHSAGDFKRNAHYQYDGFTGFWEYFNSGYVEILDFYGDYYDPETQEVMENHLITVIDRSYVIRKQPLDNWIGYAPIRHCGWRLRQDNLYAMGPLDNLVGLQYRIDHLENCKADAWDTYIHPMVHVKGEVSDFVFGPGQRVYSDVDGAVEFLRPDANFMNADTQIDMYERKMEEMAGAPKEAVGFRTPGEKTAYEVQVLENAANKVFVNKVSYFEEMFLEPCLNDMLEAARRNLNEADLIRVIDDATQAVTFKKIEAKDIVAAGKLRPMGARHFAQNAQTLQNITQFANSPLAQDPTINSHISGKRLALVLENLLGLEQYGIIQENVRLMEMAELQDANSSMQQKLMEKHTAGMSPEQAAQVAAQATAVQQEGAAPSGQ